MTATRRITRRKATRRPGRSSASSDPARLVVLHPSSKATSTTLFPALQTHAPTLPLVDPANSSHQNRPSLPCQSSLIPHSPPQGRRSHSRDFVPWRFSDACCQHSQRGPYPGVRKTCTGSDLSRRRKDAVGQHYSITSSARETKDSGITSPIAFAAFRLMTSWYLVGS